MHGLCPWLPKTTAESWETWVSRSINRLINYWEFIALEGSLSQRIQIFFKKPIHEVERISHYSCPSAGTIFNNDVAAVPTAMM
jgi:hypothetical protein